MSDLPSSYTEGNRVYWKIPECLPVGKEEVIKDFRLHNKSWQYVAYYFESYQRIMVKIDPISLCVSTSSKVCGISSSFKVRGGIIGDSQREIVSIDAIKYLKIKPVFLMARPVYNFVVVGLVSPSKLDLYLKNNKVLYFFIEMKDVNTPGTGSLKPKKLGKRKFEEDYENLLLSGTDSDLTIEVKDKKFKCHRSILYVRSPVFSAMLENDMKEKASGVVRITGAEPTVFQEFLLYLYTGNNDHLSWENVTDLYKLGDKYTVEDLKRSCVELMKRNISTENFRELFLLSQQCNDLILTETTVQFFLENPRSIVNNENWLTFLSQNPAECNVLIKALAQVVTNM